MINTVDFSKPWVFQYPGLVKNEFPLSITHEDHSISFKIPMNLTEVIEFHLKKELEEDTQIEGTYTVLPSGPADVKIILNVLDSGKRIQGRLEGDNSRFAIHLKRKD